MGMSIPLIAIFSLILALYSGFSENLLRNQSQTIFFMQKKKELASSDSGLEIAKESLRSDSNWLNCEDADSLCGEEDENGLFPVYSTSLTQSLSEIDLGSGSQNLSVFFYPLSETEGILLSETKSADGKNVHAQLVQQGFQSSNDFLPVFYANSIMIDDNIKVGSYLYNISTHSIGDKINPKLSIYLNTNLTQNLDIDIPSNGESEVETYSNLTDFTYNNDLNYFRLYSTGNIVLENESILEVAFSNRTVTEGENIVVSSITENGEMSFPNFAELELKDIKNNGSTTDITCTAGEFKIIEEGSYNKLTLKTGCSMYLNGKDFSFNEIEGILDERYASSKSLIYYYGDIVNIKTMSFLIKEKGNVEFNNMGYDSKYLNISTNTFTNYSKLTIFDPKGALLESNTFTMKENSSFIGESLSKNFILNSNSVIKGKIYGDSIVTNGSNIGIYNLIDSDGDEYTNLQWKDISWDESGSGQDFVKVVDVIRQDYCKEKIDCLNRLKTYYEEQQITQ